MLIAVLGCMIGKKERVEWLGGCWEMRLYTDTCGLGVVDLQYRMIVLECSRSFYTNAAFHLMYAIHNSMH